MAKQDAIDAIQRLMDERGLRRKDIFSSKGRASDFMRRKRPLTLPLIQKLHFQFGIPAEVLIAPYRDTTEANGAIHAGRDALEKERGDE